MKKIKGLLVMLLSAVMVMTMNVAAFADGDNDSEKTVTATYDADVTLYKDADCNETSMGNLGIDNPARIVVYSDGTADFTLKTHEFTYYGIKGHLDGVTLEGKEGKLIKNTEYNYLISGLPSSKITAGSVLTGTFTVKVVLGHEHTGYLKINSLTAVS